MLQARDGRILFLIKALVAMLFISKISLGSLLPIPASFAFLIYQKGLHPFMNLFLCILFGTPLALLWLKVRVRNHLSGFYKLFIFLLVLILTTQTLLQIHYVNSGESAFMQIGALCASLFMMMVYGVLIPSLWPAPDFLKFVQRWSGVLVLISLLLFVLAGSSVFKGGRFVGVFKHIPHMVTCATVAFVFSLGTFLREAKAQHKIWSLLILCASFFAIVLTGTRSSAGAALMAFVVTMVLHRTVTNEGRIFKFLFLSLIVTVSLFFGADIYEFTRGLATGQSSLGGREAQDGVASRWEEVQRGSQIFLQEPWLGHGLLSKFASGGEVDVANYNAMKDPHNIFISAGVIGGWPLVVLSVVGLIFMIVAALKSLKAQDVAKRQIAIYLLAHIPILVIYHVHLSLGGMADRLYWMVFGFVAASAATLSNDRTALK
ncbi:MAG: O-antigen ligase family protein [Bdellovibrio sp.]|nr:O-antigen ligase family protein [Bdellovibrio sp.]